MNYQIITDSCCDYPTPMYKELGLTFVPLTVEFRGKSFDDKNDDSLKEMYDGFRAGEPAKTSAVNPSRWGEVMEAALRNGQDVLVLAFSSGLSTTYQSAVIAAEELAEKYPDRTIRSKIYNIAGAPENLRLKLISDRVHIKFKHISIIYILKLCII